MKTMIHLYRLSVAYAQEGIALMMLKSPFTRSYWAFKVNSRQAVPTGKPERYSALCNRGVVSGEMRNAVVNIKN